MQDQTQVREHIAAEDNPIGLDGIEYVEFTTPRPQALGQLLESVGFRPVARHRSREVLVYRQGAMNIVVNAHAAVLRSVASAEVAVPTIRALALRVRDARAAYERALELGAWDVPMHAQVMELNIPGIHGPGGTHIYFVDRYREFSIYSVDFIAIPGADSASAGDWPACTSSAWCSTSAATAPPTGSSSTRGCSASARWTRRRASASCRGAR